MQYGQEVSQLFLNQTPAEFTGALQFCGICGGLIHPTVQDQHTNYHATVQRILDELAKFAVTPTATAWNGWLDLENLRLGELT